MRASLSPYPERTIMPIVQDHPLRLRRLRMGVSQAELGRRAGVSRSVIAQIEEGRVRNPNERILEVISTYTHTPIGQIREELDKWYERESKPPTKRAVYALSMPADYVARYASYDQWRRDIAENPTQFATLLRVSRNTITAFENGETRGMPKPMVNALYNRLGLNDDYVAAVLALPRENEPKEAGE